VILIINRWKFIKLIFKISVSRKDESHHVLVTESQLMVEKCYYMDYSSL
jgi:hypothetical protein